MKVEKFLHDGDLESIWFAESSKLAWNPRQNTGASINSGSDYQ